MGAEGGGMERKEATAYDALSMSTSKRRAQTFMFWGPKG